MVPDDCGCVSVIIPGDFTAVVVLLFFFFPLSFCSVASSRLLDNFPYIWMYQIWRRVFLFPYKFKSYWGSDEEGKNSLTVF